MKLSTKVYVFTLFSILLLLQYSNVYFVTADSRQPEATTRRRNTLLRRGDTSESNRDLLETGQNIARSLGEKELLVIRIESDSSTTATEAQLFNDIFDDEVNVSKQYEACSRGKLTMKPAQNQNKNINNGVTTVKLDSVVGKTTEEVYLAIEEQGPARFGKELSEFNQVMICMPLGALVNNNGKLTDKWIAFVPGKRPYLQFMSIYSDEWCSSVSAGMHEIGHTLALQHAGENAEYDDETGQMGFSAKTELGPIKCFNPAKSWQLGWYAEQSKRINPFIDAPFSTIMTGITRDINDDDKTKNVLIQIPNGETNIYIGYNLADGFNSGTEDGQDKVLITEQKAGGFQKSYLRAKLDTTDSYTINNYEGTGKNLIVQMNERYGDEAVVDIYFENDSSKQAGCNDDQIRFEVNVVTDAFPQDSSWELVNDSTGKIVASRSEYSQKDTSYDDLVCIDRKQEYKFTMYDGYGDGLCCKRGWGGYSAFLEGEELFRGGEFSNVKSVNHEFKTEQKGPPTQAPTRFPTKPPTQAPTQVPTRAPTLPPTDRCEDDVLFLFKYRGVCPANGLRKIPRSVATSNGKIDSLESLALYLVVYAKRQRETTPQLYLLLRLQRIL